MTSAVCSQCFHLGLKLLLVHSPMDDDQDQPVAQETEEKHEVEEGG